MSPGALYIFGYGSLPFSPELPEAVLEVVPARLLGHRRSFNKISSRSQCRAGESFAAFGDPLGRFRRGSWYRSLVLGTEPSAGEGIDGFLLAYPQEVREALLAVTDRREGFDVHRPALDNGYLRVEQQARLLDGGRTRTCLVYLSNPDPACAYHAPDELSLAQRAQVLVNATPRAPAGPAERRGLYYLERVRAVLREQAGLRDPQLEALAEAIRALPGPWVELVAAPWLMMHR